MQNPGTAVVPGYGAGATVNFIIRGWQAPFSNGADWESAKQNLFYPGQSQMGYVILGGGAFPTPSAFGVADGQVPGFVLTAPEPSSLALFGIGAAACLIFRRRNWN